MEWNPRDSILPPDWIEANQLLETARSVRMQTEMFVPVLAWQQDDGSRLLTLVPYGRGQLLEAVGGALEMLDQFYGKPAWFAVVLDAYGRITDLEDEPDILPEELSDLFLVGDEGVVEQLMLLLAKDGQLHVWRQVYRYTPVDGWEWDDPQYLVHPVMPEDNGLIELFRRRSQA